MAADPKNLAIVKAIVQMASSLGIATVAEGIEDEATLALLVKLGCTVGQGYYWSKPIPAAEFTRLYC